MASRKTYKKFEMSLILMAGKLVKTTITRTFKLCNHLRIHNLNYSIKKKNWMFIMVNVEDFEIEISTSSYNNLYYLHFNSTSTSYSSYKTVVEKIINEQNKRIS